MVQLEVTRNGVFFFLIQVSNLAAEVKHDVRRSNWPFHFASKR